MRIIVWSTMKNYWNFFRHTIFQITYAMCSISILPCIMKMISNFTIFFIFYLSNIYFYFLSFVSKYKIFEFSYDSCCSFVNNFIFNFKIIFIGCSIKNSQNFFMHCLPLYISCLSCHTSKGRYCKHWKTWWNMLTYLWCRLDSELFLHLSAFSVIDSRFAWIINRALSYFSYWLNSDLLVSSEGIMMLQKSLFSHTFLCKWTFSFVAKEWRQAIKLPWCLEVILLNNADSFLIAR